MTSRLKIILLTLILLLGFSLRVYDIASLPPGLTWDEAALGYNAYSILKTARDEHGASMPLIFKSFGDYKPGLYVYLSVPFIAALGLSETSTRLPSSIFGTLAIIGIYLLTKELLLFHNRSKTKQPNIEIMALLSSFVLAISPWHIHFSRGAWEVNIFSTLLLFAIYYFIKSLQDKRFFLPWVALSTLTILTYQGAKMLTPLIFTALFVIYHKQLKNIFLKWVSPLTNRLFLLLSVILLAVLFLLNITGPAGNRLSRLSVFNYKPELSGNIFFHNRPLIKFRMIASRYLYHFSPEVLFYQGNIFTERGHVPKQGVLYITDSLLLFLGLIYLVKSKNKYLKKTLFSLLLLSPVPAALTLAEFSTIRDLFLVFPLSIIISFGLYFLYINFNKLIFITVFIFIALNTVLSLDIYFNHSYTSLAPEFNYGYKQAFEKINSSPKADKIVFTDVYGQPYIYYLFYSKFDPRLYQSLNSYIDMGVDVGKVDKIGDFIEFHQFGTGDMKNSKNTWFVGSVGNIKDKLDKNKDYIQNFYEIKLPYSTPVFRMIKTK